MSQKLGNAGNTGRFRAVDNAHNPALRLGFRPIPAHSGEWRNLAECPLLGTNEFAMKPCRNAGLFLCARPPLRTVLSPPGAALIRRTPLSGSLTRSTDSRAINARVRDPASARNRDRPNTSHRRLRPAWPVAIRADRPGTPRRQPLKSTPPIAVTMAAHQLRKDGL